MGRLMTPSRMLRPVLLGLVGLTTASCGMVEGDPHRFESMAQAVASVSLEDGDVPALAASQPPLRPAVIDATTTADPGALRVEVLDPHQLWDARDAGLRGAVQQAGPAMIDAAAPIVAQAMMQQVSDRVSAVRTVAEPQGRPMVTRAVDVRPVETGRRETLQLGAFSSLAAARAAWTRISAAGSGVASLSPAYETVDVDGRTLTRLKVSASGETVRAVCRAADAADMGCLRRG